MDVLRFHPDGNVTIEFPDGGVTLRPPTIGEWRMLFALWEDADRQLRDTPEQDRPAVLWGIEVGANPYADALAETVGLLSSSAKPDPDKLPLWAGLPGIWLRLYAHWRVAQFEYVEAADPFVPVVAEEPAPPAAPAPDTVPPSARPAASADIEPVNLDELRATAPVPATATGGISHQGEIGM